MRKSLVAFLAVAVLATACSRQKPVVTPSGPTPFPVSFAFTAASPVDLAMEGNFEGTATYENGWLTVNVPRTTITVPPGNSENWRNLVVRAFVATNYQRGGNYNAVAQSRPVNIFRFLNFGATKWTERRTLKLETPLTFIVPVPPGATAENSRLAFELEWIFVMGTFGDTDSRIAISAPISTNRPFP